MGQVKVDEEQYQIIIGPEVEFLADDMRKIHSGNKITSNGSTEEVKTETTEA